MSLRMESTRSRCEVELIRTLLSMIKKHPGLLPFISRQLFTFKKYDPDNVNDFKEDTELNIVLVDEELDDKYQQRAVDTLIDLYLQPNYEKLRSIFLEEVVIEFGPYSLEKPKPYFLEPKITENGKLIGGLYKNKKCDVVFYENESVPIEMIECKVNIGNFLSREFNKMKEVKRNQVLYLNSVYQHLTEKYIKPFIYYACYNENYDFYQDNVHNNWGFRHLRFINMVDIKDGFGK